MRIDLPKRLFQQSPSREGDREAVVGVSEVGLGMSYD